MLRVKMEVLWAGKMLTIKLNKHSLFLTHLDPLEYYFADELHDIIQNYYSR